MVSWAKKLYFRLTISFWILTLQPSVSVAEEKKFVLVYDVDETSLQSLKLIFTSEFCLKNRIRC